MSCFRNIKIDIEMNPIEKKQGENWLLVIEIKKMIKSSNPMGFLMFRNHVPYVFLLSINSPKKNICFDSPYFLVWIHVTIMISNKNMVEKAVQIMWEPFLLGFFTLSHHVSIKFSIGISIGSYIMFPSFSIIFPRISHHFPSLTIIFHYFPLDVPSFFHHFP